MIMRLVSRSNGSKEPYTIEMVLMDDKGGKIQASVTQKHFNKFKKNLKEGKTYMFCNVLVAQNDSTNRATLHMNKITFVGATTVTEFAANMIPTLSPL
ncbi:hypothetical protein ABFX02_08G105300 [Erythranthe guttata]